MRAFLSGDGGERSDRKAPFKRVALKSMDDEAAALQTKLEPSKLKPFKASRRLSAVCLAASSPAATLLLLRGATCCLGALSRSEFSDLILHASLSIAPHYHHLLLFFFGWVSPHQRDERLRCKAHGSY